MLDQLTVINIKLLFVNISLLPGRLRQVFPLYNQQLNIVRRDVIALHLQLKLERWTDQETPRRCALRKQPWGTHLWSITPYHNTTTSLMCVYAKNKHRNPLVHPQKSKEYFPISPSGSPGGFWKIASYPKASSADLNAGHQQSQPRCLPFRIQNCIVRQRVVTGPSSTDYWPGSQAPSFSPWTVM